MQPTVAVRELKNDLSRYLRLVQEGNEVIVTSHGRPVAVLAPIPTDRPAKTPAEGLAQLALRGLIRLGTGVRVRAPRPLDRNPDVSGAVIEDREDRA